jgi:hypothetical protein
LIILLILTAGIYFFVGNYKYNTKSPDQITKELVKEVSKYMVIPNEDPAIFTIQNPELLISQQAFFKGAEKDDTLLIFKKAGKAIIFSSKRHLIVNAGPVNFDQNKDQEQFQPTTIKPQ